MSRSFGGRIENRGELAVTFGVTLVTVDTWVRSGCPVVERPAGRGQQWQFNTAEVARWRERRALESALGSADKVETEEIKRRNLRLRLVLLS